MEKQKHTEQQMQIGQKFNRFTLKEYFFYIDNHKKYTDFNTLGLYRSLLENEKLSIEDKITVREYAHKTFRKAFDFLQLKDPGLYVKVSTLGLTLSNEEDRKLWDEVRRNQEQMLKSKRIKHRNFGKYSKHSCAYKDCRYYGLMIRQGSILTEDSMHFDSDKNQYMAKIKSDTRRKERKTVKRIIEENTTEK